MRTAIRVCCPFCLAVLAEMNPKRFNAARDRGLFTAHRDACPCWNRAAARLMHLED